MKKLSEFPDNEEFWRGTIIVLKGAHKSPKGDFDSKYCMIQVNHGNFAMLDLYRSMGAVIWLDLEPTQENKYACSKKAIKDWARLYFETFYTDEFKREVLNDAYLDDIVYVEDLHDYFVQANRDLFMSEMASAEELESEEDRIQKNYDSDGVSEPYSE